MGEGTSNGLTAFGTILSEVWSGIGSVVDTIKTEPLLLIPIALLFAGACIGLAKKLMGTGKKKR